MTVPVSFPLGLVIAESVIFARDGAMRVPLPDTLVLGVFAGGAVLTLMLTVAGPLCAAPPVTRY